MSLPRPYYDDGGGRVIYLGDAIGVLRQLPDESVNCCVTSPPYWGLRDYGTAEWEGGDEGCDHKEEWSDGRQQPGAWTTGGQIQHGLAPSHRGTCPKCGARRIDSQLGLESTPEEYVAKMVEVFREIRRVLRSDGTAWVNLGDSYASNPASGGPQSERLAGPQNATPNNRSYQRPPGLKPKDLCGIPWRVAFALQADGWYLRQDIIWAKPNPMPESVTDRCTKAHEYVFLLSKSARYWFDADAIREKSARAGEITGTGPKGLSRGQAKGANVKPSGNAVNGGCLISPQMSNRRSVWTIATQPYSEAHFATFPVKLVEPCIKAGCPEGGTVLDPFFGSGTVGLVAARWGRKSIGIELNAEYCLMAIKRLERETIQPELPFEPVERLRQEVLF